MSEANKYICARCKSVLTTESNGQIYPCEKCSEEWRQVSYEIGERESLLMPCSGCADLRAKCRRFATAIYNKPTAEDVAIAHAWLVKDVVKGGN
jgi:DNA-directed RNA polymerase subunit RPC12/RpoP